MQQFILFFTLVTLTFSLPNVPYKAYSCQNGVCAQLPLGSKNGVSLEVCSTNCGEYGSLWPRPASVTLGSNTIPFGFSYVTFNYDVPTPVSNYMSEAANLFMSTMYSQYNGKVLNNSQNVLNINLHVSTPNITLELDISENYTLSVYTSGNKVIAQIASLTFFGARHGLETLSQLIGYDDITETLQIVSSVSITDGPAFPYRGVTLDASRNFYPISSVKRMIDAMSYNKLNNFHFHFTDSQSFPFESFKQPNLTYYGAYSPEKVYTQKDLNDLISYATTRGVRVVPEIDAPAHAGMGWQWGPEAGLGELSLCISQSPYYEYCLEPNCGQLNPLNFHVYDILTDLYTEMIQIFGKQSNLFHMGGDEVSIPCWNSSEVILNWLHNNNLTRSEENFLHLWGLFQSMALNSINQANKNKPINALLWSNQLVLSQPFVDKYFSLNKDKYIIIAWSSSDTQDIPFLLTNGFRVVVSNWDAWYLDCGFGNFVSFGTSWCSPYKDWKVMYENKPYSSFANKWNITDPAERALLIGGSCGMWSEQVDENSVEIKVWPRAAAVAERLWSDPQESWFEADTRMQNQRARIVARGIHADELQPEWCLQNPGQCSTLHLYQSTMEEEQNTLENSDQQNEEIQE